MKWPALMSAPAKYTWITPIFIANMTANSMCIPFTLVQKGESIDTEALIDSGAQGQFIDQDFVQKHQIKTRETKTPIKTRNADGTMNQHGDIQEYTWIKAIIGGKEMEIQLWVTKLGGQNIILGLPWLKIWNPQINWSTGEMEIPDKPTGWQRMANSFQKAIKINYFWVNNYQTKPQ